MVELLSENQNQEPAFDLQKLEALQFLKSATPAGWGAQAVADLPRLMSDHAWCERKASGNCLSLLAAHTDFPVVTEPMIRLAREELEHFHMVFNHMRDRGFALEPEKRDTYVRQLRTQVRSDAFQLMDRLLIAAVIEARSCERLGLIAQALKDSSQDTSLINFYERLTRSESRHFLEFVKLAESIFEVSAVKARLDQLLDWEHHVIQGIAWGSRVH